MLPPSCLVGGQASAALLAWAVEVVLALRPTGEEVGQLDHVHTAPRLRSARSRRRWRPDMPAAMPWSSCPSAHCRQSSTTGHSAQMARASTLDSPRLGKNVAVGIPRQAARRIQGGRAASIRRASSRPGPMSAATMTSHGSPNHGSDSTAVVIGGRSEGVCRSGCRGAPRVVSFGPVSSSRLSGGIPTPGRLDCSVDERSVDGNPNRRTARLFRV